jgi:uncharacterized protein YeaO (DUF488 family)
MRTKRVYEAPAKDDGTRILVDRLWPRGIKKEKLDAVWIRDVAPSTELRKWFRHESPKWAEFKRRYFEELDANPGAVEELRKWVGKGRTTLLFAAQDEEQNHAVALVEYLRKRRR